MAGSVPAPHMTERTYMSEKKANKDNYNYNLCLKSIANISTIYKRNMGIFYQILKSSQYPKHEAIQIKRIDYCFFRSIREKKNIGFI